MRTLNVTRPSDVKCLIDKWQRDIGERIDDIRQYQNITNRPRRISPHVIDSHRMWCGLSAGKTGRYPVRAIQSPVAVTVAVGG